MDINRTNMLDKIISGVHSNKVLLIYGPRRVGKTTLLTQLAKRLGGTRRMLLLNGEERRVQDDLSAQSVERLRRTIGDHDLLIVDEAQHIPSIGLNLKLLVDHLPGLAVIASGSASLALAREVGEPLTGRRTTIRIYPVAASEFIATTDVRIWRDTLEEHLIYGGYPERYTLPSFPAQQAYLAELVDAYLFRDILALEQVRNPRKLRDLCTLLALQIGHEVAHAELANALDLNARTVSRYLDLLEQAFVIVNVRGLSRNLRKEVTKTSRYYFLDNGVRNALINNFNPLKLRSDVGMLWENYGVLERMKRNAFCGTRANVYFWRTYDQQEIDLVEERGGRLHAYEFTWQEQRRRPPSAWHQAYPDATYETVHRENILETIAWECGG